MKWKSETYAVLALAVFVALSNMVRAGDISPESRSKVEAVQKVKDGDEDLYLKSEQLLNKGRLRAGILLLDVREPDQFRLAHIEGAVPLPLHLIRTKKFLKSQKVVLMNQGHSTTKLVEEARELYREGFGSVKVLRFGLRGWVKSGGQVVGDVPQSSEVFFLNPEEFSEATFDRQIPIFTLGSTSAERTGATPLRPGHLVEAKEVVSYLAGNTLEDEFCLIATESGAGYAALEQQLKASQVAGRAFYLRGGWAAYDDFVRAQSQMAARGEGKLGERASLRSSRTFQPQSPTVSCCGGKR